MLYEEVVFLEVEDVDAAHADAIALGGGEPSVLSPGLVESAVMTPRSGYYVSLAEMAAAYVFGIAKNHGYRDGNKRTAASVLGIFLGANGIPVVLGPEWVGYIVALAAGEMTRAELTAKIADLMGGNPVRIE